jgi:16S rRNA (guanine527-N7)-methyltransferase
LEKASCTDLLGQASQEVGVILGEMQLELFWLYLQELLEWNRVLNLTGTTDPEDIVIKHFVDSLTSLPYLDRSGLLLDIGAGAGFPAIPLKIAAPELQAQLVDARHKKVSFLKHIIRTLNLQNVIAIHSRVEDLVLREQPFRTIISRAFVRLEQLLELCSPLLEPGHKLVAMLGPTSKAQQAGFEKLAAKEGLELRRIVLLDLPLNRGSRTLLFFHKICIPSNI